MKTALFEPLIEVFDEVPGLRDLITEKPELIWNEVNLTRCDIDFSLEHCGPLTRYLLEYLLPFVENEPKMLHSMHTIIDCKYVYLQPNVYGTFPGWHADSVDKKKDVPFPYPIEEPADPLLAKKDRWNWQIIVSENGEPISEPLFCSSDALVEYDPKRPWGSIGEWIDEKYQGEYYHMAPLVPVKYNGHALHKVSPATRWGWRYWLRIQQFPVPAMNLTHQISRVFCDISKLTHQGEEPK